jgi:hypothetical protein
LRRLNYKQPPSFKEGRQMKNSDMQRGKEEILRSFWASFDLIFI